MSIDLNAMKARAEAATPGPWEAGAGWVYTDPIYPDDNRLANVLGMKFADRERANAEGERVQRNAEFIAHARTDVPALVAEVERLTAALNDVRDRLNHQDFDQSPGAGDIEAIVRAALGGADRG